MYSQHPEMAKEWEDKTPKGKKLPAKVKGKKTKVKDKKNGKSKTRQWSSF